MFGIPRRFSHFIFAVIQAGLTCLIAAGVASLPLVTIRQFIAHWLFSWVISWAAMLPVVVLAAPIIRSVSGEKRLSQGKVHPRNNSMPACRSRGQQSTRAAGKPRASYQKESNPNAHAEKDRNGEYGDASVLRFLKCLMPDIHAVYIGSRAAVAET